MVMEFQKIIDELLQSSSEEFEKVKEFEPSSTDRFDNVQNLEEDDTNEIFTVSIKNGKDVKERLAIINEEGTKRGVLAVDSSSVELGKTNIGLIAAIKAAVVFTDHVETFGPFIFHIHNNNKQRTYEYFAKDVFGLSGNHIAPILTKMTDRIRNFIERLIQRYAASQAKDSILLWDGSLGTKKSQFDTPEELLHSSLRQAEGSGNTVIAVTKKTNLMLTSNESLFSVLGGFEGPAIVYLTDKIAVFGSKTYNVLGNTYAVKFANGGIPFRVDVWPKNKSSESLVDLIRSTTFYHGYPIELRNAHIYSKITKDEALACQKMIATKYNMPIVNVPDMHKILLSPYG